MGRNLTRPDGTIVTVDTDKEAESLKKLGYTDTTHQQLSDEGAAAILKDKYTGLGSSVLTVLEGAASGLSMGATDVIGLTSNPTANLRAEYNPVKRIGGEIGGALLTAIPSGGTSLEAAGARLAAKEAVGLGKAALVAEDAARAGKAALSYTPAGLVSRGGRAIESAIGGTKGAIAAGAAEGFVGGAASAISQAQLNDDPLTIESVFASGGIGSLIGGGVGGIASKLGKVKPATELVDSVDNVAQYSDDTLESFYKTLPKDKPAKAASLLDEIPDVAPYKVTKEVVDGTKQVFEPLDSFSSVRKNLKSTLEDVDYTVSDIGNVMETHAKSLTDINDNILNYIDTTSSIVGKGSSTYKETINDLRKSIRSGDIDSISESLDSYVSKVESEISNTNSNMSKLESKVEALRKSNGNVRNLPDLKDTEDILNKNHSASLDELKDTVFDYLDNTNRVIGKNASSVYKDAVNNLKKSIRSGNVDSINKAYDTYITKLESEIGGVANGKDKLRARLDKLLDSNEQVNNFSKFKNKDITTRGEHSALLSSLDDDVSKYLDSTKSVDIRNSIKSGDIDKISESLSSYSKGINDSIGEVSNIEGKLQSLRTVSKKLQELSNLKEAANILRNFPEDISEFRKLRASSAEKMFAALDTIEKVNPAVVGDLDTALLDIGLSIDGSAGRKARTIWESTKSPGFFKQQEAKLAKTRMEFVDNIDSPTNLGINTPKVSGATPDNVADNLISELNPMPGGPAPSLDLSPGSISFAPEMLNTGAQATNDYVSSGGRKKPVGRFWKRAAESAGRRVSAAGARKVGLGVLGSAVAFEAGGSATDMLIAGMFGSTVAGNREGVTSRINRAARKAAPKVGKALEVSRGQFGRLTTRLDGTEDTKGNAKARIEEVNAAVPTIRDKAFEAMEDLAIDHPKFVKAFIDTADNFMQTLQSFMPKDPGLAFSNGKSLWEPDPVQKVQTAKVLAVAHDPEGTAEYIAGGNADMFTVKAFKALWPAQYEHFVVSTLEAIAPRIDTMDYEEQNYYATVTGIPLHSSFTPRSMAQTQSIYAASAEKARQNKAQMGGSSAPNGRPAKTEPPTTGQSLLT